MHCGPLLVLLFVAGVARASVCFGMKTGVDGKILKEVMERERRRSRRVPRMSVLPSGP